MNTSAAYAHDSQNDSVVPTLPIAGLGGYRALHRSEMDKPPDQVLLHPEDGQWVGPADSSICHIRASTGMTSESEL